jgi:hypothetical protein
MTAARQTVRSQVPTHCPDCRQPKLEFVLHVDGARCVNCHVSSTRGTRPLHRGGKG